LAQFLYALPACNINRFSKMIHCQDQEKIHNKTVTKEPSHLKSVATRGVDPYGTRQEGHVPPIFMNGGDIHGNVPQYFRSDVV